MIVELMHTSSCVPFKEYLSGVSTHTCTNLQKK